MASASRRSWSSIWWLTALLALAADTGCPSGKPMPPLSGQPSTAPAGKPPIPLRPFDQQVIDELGKPTGGKEMMGLWFGQPGPIVDFRVERGETKWTRCRIDLKGTGKWDEKWTWMDGMILRDVAPLGDEVYTKKYKLDGGAWVEVE